MTPALFNSTKSEVAHVETAGSARQEDISDIEPKEYESQGYADPSIQHENKVILGSPDSRAIERKYMRRLDLIVLPMITALYFFGYLTRGNIANAKLLGLNKGHDTSGGGVGPGKEPLSATQWEVAIMIFYIGLILFQVPGCIGYRLVSPSKWIAFSVCFWNVASMLQDAATNYAGLLVCRVFLGVFEGLFGTGIVYYLSIWYHRTELGVRVFWYLGPTAIAGAFGGLIAYGMGHVKSSTPQWKWLFLVEAAPGFCLGLLCLYWMPDRPMKNSRFKGKLQEVAVARYHAEAVDRTGPIQRKHVIWAVQDWKLYMQALIYLPTAALLSSISGFLPTIVNQLGYDTPAKANLMTVPPYACAFVLMYVISWTSDHYKERGLHIAGLSLVSTICFLVIANLPDNAFHAKYGLICLSTACVYATYPPSHAWAANNFGNETKRAIGMGMYTALGNTGSIAGSFFYPVTDGPIYKKGHWLSFGMSLAALVFSLSNSLILGAVNRYRDRKYGKPVPGLAIDVTENADNLPTYRFIT